MKKNLNLIIKGFIIKGWAILMILGMTDSAAFSQTRVRFARGKKSVILNGNISNGAEKSYVLGASAGQTMTVRVTSKSGDVSVDIGGNDVGKGTSVQLRSTDDYIITIHNTGNAVSYSLYIGVR